jgi:hypothetical protein
MNGEARVLSLAGRSLRIETTSARASAALLPAFAHLTAAPSAGDRQARWTIVEEDEAWHPRAIAGNGTYWLRSGGLAFVQDEPALLESYHPETGIELRAAPTAFATGELRAHPARRALAAWFDSPSTQVLHAGAVAHEDAAALLIGWGGAGKSTTAIACALAGAGFLGDDLVVVEAHGGCQEGAECTVHGLFATAKVNADSARALGIAAWPCLGVTAQDKVVFRVENRLRIVRSARIVALIVLAPPVPGRPQAAPLALPNALTAILRTSLPLAWRASAPAAWLAAAARLARRLPAYRLPVSWDLDGLAAAVREIVCRAAGRSGRAARS